MILFALGVASGTASKEDMPKLSKALFDLAHDIMTKVEGHG